MQNINHKVLTFRAGTLEITPGECKPSQKLLNHWKIQTGMFRFLVCFHLHPSMTSSSSYETQMWWIIIENVPLDVWYSGAHGAKHTGASDPGAEVSWLCSYRIILFWIGFVNNSVESHLNMKELDIKYLDISVTTFEYSVYSDWKDFESAWCQKYHLLAWRRISPSTLLSPFKTP